MIPKQLAKSGTEHAHQVALFAYCAVAHLHGFDAADDWSKGEPLRHSVAVAPAVPALEWLHAIHNQGHGDKIRGGRARAEGVRAGVADVFLPWPVRRSDAEQQSWFIHRKGFPYWHGLYIEMKKPDAMPKRKGKGGVSESQQKFGEYAKRVGYGFSVCYGWQMAASVLRSYIEWEG